MDIYCKRRGKQANPVGVKSIVRIEDETVYLKLDKAGFEKLPVIAPHRRLLNPV